MASPTSAGGSHLRRAALACGGRAGFSASAQGLSASDGEMARRLADVRQEMLARKIDALVIYGHAVARPDEHAGQLNVQYLARYAAGAESYLVVPLTADPTLLLSARLHVLNARTISCIADVRCGDALGATIARLKELGLGRSKIGTVGPGLASHPGLTMFKAARVRLGVELPNAYFEAANGWFDHIRTNTAAPAPRPVAGRLRETHTLAHGGFPSVD